MKETTCFAMFMIAMSTVLPALAIDCGTYASRPGGTVQVHVAITQPLTAACVNARFTYDPQLLSVTGVVLSDGMQASGFMIGTSVSDGVVDVVIASDEEQSIAAGTLLEIGSTVNVGAKPGMHSRLGISRFSVAGAMGHALRLDEAMDTEGILWVIYGSEDTDGDGLSDYEEQMFDGSPEYSPGVNDPDVNRWDTDSDGMPDGWEYLQGLNLFVNDAMQDNDGDGGSNLSEWIAGTSASNRYDQFEISSLQEMTNGLVARWRSVPGRYYAVYGSTNTPTGPWTTNAPARVAIGQESSYTGSASDSRGFIRIGVRIAP